MDSKSYRGIVFVFLVVSFVLTIIGFACMFFSPSYWFLVPLGVVLFIFCALLLSGSGDETVSQEPLPDVVVLDQKGVFESEFNYKKRNDPIKNKDFD